MSFSESVVAKKTDDFAENLLFFRSFISFVLEFRF